MIWIVLLLSVAIGSGAAWVVPTDSKAFKYLLSFSGAFLFATLLTHMLPEIFEHGNWNMGWWIMLGFAIQLLLDHLSEGLEHGHFHTKASKVPWLAISGLLLHAFLEGMPLASSGASGHNHATGGFLWAIALHKLPIALLVTGALRKSGVRLSTLLGVLLLFAFATPAGALTVNTIPVEQWSLQLLAVAVGILLHVSTTILFESSQNHRFNAVKLIFVLAGMLLAGWINSGMML